MSRTIAGLILVALAMFAAACTGSTPAASPGASPASSPVGPGSSPIATEGPGTSTPASAAPASAAPTDAGGLGEELTVEQLCAALTAEELSEIFGEEVTIDPAEEVWCGYDFEDGSGMLLVPFGTSTAEDFIEQGNSLGCETKPLDVGGAVISSCGGDLAEGRPTEAWFLLNGVPVQLSVPVDATEEQFIEMIRQALD